MMISCPSLTRDTKFSGTTPHGHVYESSDLLTFAFAVVKNSLFAIVAVATEIAVLVSLKAGLATRLPVMMM